MDISNTKVSTIINALKEEIVSFGTPEGRENLERFIIADEKGTKDNIFVRKSRFTAPILIDYILRHSPLSTTVSLYDFFSGIGEDPVTKSAFSQRRTRLDPEVFNHLNRNFINRSYAVLSSELELWHGWHLIACDGSDIELVDTEPVAEHFGRYIYVNNKGEKCEGSPMAKALMVNDMLNGFTLWSKLCPYNKDERNAFEEMVPEIQATAPFNLSKTICVLDRGYFSLKLIYLLAKTSMKYVVRVQNPGGIIRQFIDSGEKERIIEWSPSSNTSLSKYPDWIKEGGKPLAIRLVRVELPKGEVEVLATNLTVDEVPHSMMKKLYFMRWPIEVDYLHYKHVLVIEAFSGARPLCVMQDFYATVVDYNIACLIEDDAKKDVEEENKHKEQRYKTNFAVLVGIFFSEFINLMILDKLDSAVTSLKKVAREKLTPIMEGRSFPRVRKRRKSSDRQLTRNNRKRVS